MKQRIVLLMEDDFDKEVRLGNPKAILSTAELKAVQRALRQHAKSHTAPKKAGPGGQIAVAKKKKECHVLYCVAMPDEVVCRVRCK